jgi:hypothetical protein
MTGNLTGILIESHGSCLVDTDRRPRRVLADATREEATAALILVEAAVETLRDLTKPQPGERPADVELAEAAQAIADERGLSLGEAMSVALSEDADLAERYATRGITGAAKPGGGTIDLSDADARAAATADIRSRFLTQVGNLTSATGPRSDLFDACSRVIREDPDIAAAMGLTKTS